MKQKTRNILSGCAAVVAGISGRALYEGLIVEGYDPERISECLPGYASTEPATEQKAQALLNDYQSLDGRGYMDQAADDDLPFQSDNVNGIGELVCRLTTDEGQSLVFTSTGRAMAHDAVLTSLPQGS